MPKLPIGMTIAEAESIRERYEEEGLTLLDLEHETIWNRNQIRLAVVTAGGTIRPAKGRGMHTEAGPRKAKPSGRSPLPQVPRSSGAHRRRRDR